MDLCDIDQGFYDEKEWFRRDRDTWHEPSVHPESSRFATGSLWIRSFAVSQASADDDLASRFEYLRNSWHREYGFSSSFTEIQRCHSYRQIVDLGLAMPDKILPLIFQDLKRRPEPDHWFNALVTITKVDPVPMRYRGYARKMAKIWLAWAHKHGYA